MEQYSSEQNSMQISGAANATWSEDAEIANIENQLILANYEEFFESFPPGYRFIPTDEELIEDYLKKKVNNEPLPPNLIREVIFYSKDPTQLIENSCGGSAKHHSITENKWYFFTPRDRKYPNGSRPNRATPNGHWKPAGKDTAIFQSHGSRHPVGKKRTLDFYEGKHNRGSKTVWKMHEYTLDNSSNNQFYLNNSRSMGDMTLDDWVLCKLYKNERSGGDEANISNSGTQPPTVNVAQNNTASNVPENNEASLVAENTNMVFEEQNPNASQVAPNQASMCQEPMNFQSFCNASSPQNPNRLRPDRATPNGYLAQDNEATNSLVGDSHVEFQNQPTSNQSNLQSFHNINQFICNEDYSWADIVES